MNVRATMRIPKLILTATAVLTTLGVFGCGGGAEAAEQVAIGDEPALSLHTNQDDIESGRLETDEIIDRGRELFLASFNTLDGAGRPGTTDVGDSNTRSPRMFPDNFNRISGPDANTCAVCHHLPRLGGGGDNAVNVFTDAERLPFVNFDGGEGDGLQEQTLRSVGNERNTAGIFGIGFVELLAREMTVELQGIVDGATEESKSAGVPVTRDLVAKGVSFGRVTARPNGTVDTSEVKGVDDDFIIKPIQSKGHIVSLREFVVKAMNSHFGIQAVERFGADADGDGVLNELTPGDVTALVVFMATLPPPGRVMPSHPEAFAAVERGETLFSEIGCAACHIPELPLATPIFTEPSPFNPTGKLQLSEVAQPFAVDLATEGPGPRLRRREDGTIMVPVFTDLKRHDMGDVLDNETLVISGVPTDMWLTRKLWSVASEPPFLHHGRATLMSEAILAHGGEGQAARDAFAELLTDDQAAVVEFLKTLQVLPEGSTDLVVTEGEAGGGGDRTIWILAGVGAAEVVAVVVLVGVAIRRRARKAAAA